RWPPRSSSSGSTHWLRRCAWAASPSSWLPCQFSLSLAGGRVAGAKPIVDALGEVVGSLRLAEDVPGVALDGGHDAQRRVDALVDRRDVGVDPPGHVEDGGG